MKILAIETSCDDTGVAILEVKDGDFKVLSNIVASQIEVHKKYGGVYPMLAKREHQRNLIPTLTEALKEAGMLKKPDKSPKGHFDGPATIPALRDLGGILEREPDLLKKIIPFFKKYTPRGTGQKPDVDLIAVTNGPGLEPCLWVGINFAKALSFFWGIPVVPVNHIESHILINFLSVPVHRSTGTKFPAIALVVSGGHTQLILISKPFDSAQGKYKIIGETRDDAAGECFDKCAKILGLGYPGGPIISQLAAKFVGCPTSHKLPRPMINTKDYDFSFSGLKTAVLYADRKIKNKTVSYKKQMSAEIQQAIIDVLIKKTIKATKDFKVKTIIMGGGVVANKELKKQFSEKVKLLADVNLLIPETKYCTDNGLMAAITGYFKAKQNKFTKWQDLEAKANLRVE